MNTCKDCGISLMGVPQKYTGRCAKCWQIEYFYSSPYKLMRHTHRHHKSNSKRRGHPPPTYTWEELLAWAQIQPNFKPLYDTWVASGYQTPLYPSVDRINNNLPYVLTNLQFMTFRENQQKFCQEVIRGEHPGRTQRVDALDLEGNFVKTYHSIHEAARQVGGYPGNIFRAVTHGTTSVGFKWRRTP
jgi:hypothetical protein